MNLIVLMSIALLINDLITPLSVRTKDQRLTVLIVYCINVNFPIQDLMTPSLLRTKL